jgi:hypothetical protein
VRPERGNQEVARQPERGPDRPHRHRRRRLPRASPSAARGCHDHKFDPHPAEGLLSPAGLPAATRTRGPSRSPTPEEEAAVQGEDRPSSRPRSVPAQEAAQDRPGRGADPPGAADRAAWRTRSRPRRRASTRARPDRAHQDPRPAPGEWTRRATPSACACPRS